jgi:hypothetical protein
MKSSTKTTIFFGTIFLGLMVCLSCLAVGEAGAQVSFTYSAPITEKRGDVGDTTEFNSTLTNTGSGQDTYDIDMIEKSPTPVNWWMQFCSDGVCWDSTITNSQVTLNPSESDAIDLEVLPRSTANGKVTMRITSQANPSLKDSITFILKGRKRAPALNLWGMIVLIILISSSAVYLILRRLKPSRAT